MKNIIEFLKDNASNNPNKLFCVDETSQYTYLESYNICQKIAGFLYQEKIENNPILIRAK